MQSPPLNCCPCTLQVPPFRGLPLKSFPTLQNALPPGFLPITVHVPFCPCATEQKSVGPPELVTEEIEHTLEVVPAVALHLLVPSLLLVTEHLLLPAPPSAEQVVLLFEPVLQEFALPPLTEHVRFSSPPPELDEHTPPPTNVLHVALVLSVVLQDEL